MEIREVLNRRTDLSTFVVHLTRESEGRTPRQALDSIINEQMLRARTPMGWAKDQDDPTEPDKQSQRVVCFSETPLEHIYSLVSEIDGRVIHLAPYRLAFTKLAARRMGINPIWYVDMTPGRDWILRNAIEALRDQAVATGRFHEQPVARITPFLEQMGTWPMRQKEFWWEREWRHVGDLRLPDEGIIWLCPEDEASSLPVSPVIDPRWGLEQIIAHLAGLRNRRSQVRILTGALKRFGSVEGNLGCCRTRRGGNTGGNKATVTVLPLERTDVPGVYRRGSRYVVVYRSEGRQRKQTAPTFAEARSISVARDAEAHEERRGPTLHAFALGWLERYAGSGRDSVRENTRREYRRLLETFALRYFDHGVRVRDLERAGVQRFVDWLTARPGRKGRLSDRSVANALTPLRLALDAAVAQGLLETNPASAVVLPRRCRGRAWEPQERRFLTRDELARLLDEVPSRWRPLFDLLAVTGLRISEAIALRWSDLVLDQPALRLRVSRAIVKGVAAAPKSRHGARSVPLPPELVATLRRQRPPEAADDDPVFPGRDGGPAHAGSLRRRVLVPAAKRAGLPGVGFHTLRHTCASLLIESGLSVLRLQRWMGHHSPAFTLEVYGHLIDGDLGPPLDLRAELRTARPRTARADVNVKARPTGA